MIYVYTEDHYITVELEIPSNDTKEVLVYIADTNGDSLDDLIDDVCNLANVDLLAASFNPHLPIKYQIASNVVQQDNAYDCGVLSCQRAYFCKRFDDPITVPQEWDFLKDLTTFRVFMLAEILKRYRKRISPLVYYESPKHKRIDWTVNYYSNVQDQTSKNMNTAYEVPNMPLLEDKDMSEGFAKKVANTQVWKAIFRHGPPNNARNRAAVVAGNVFLHLHPIKLKKSGVQLGYTWCMGGLTFFVFLALTVTGVLLMFYYRPTAEYAFTDIIGLREHVPLGIMRELHRWGAHLMVITVWIHMFRVFMTGSYKPPREFNWGVGVILLILTMLLSFTGYLLPWDQLAIWAITVGSNMAKATPFAGHGGPGAMLAKIGDFVMVSDKNDVRFQLLGGRFVGEAALLRFYILHCVFIPLVVAVLIAVHFWRVRKDGGISAPL